MRQIRMAGFCEFWKKGQQSTNLQSREPGRKPVGRARHYAILHKIASKSRTGAACAASEARFVLDPK